MFLLFWRHFCIIFWFDCSKIYQVHLFTFLLVLSSKFCFFTMFSCRMRFLRAVSCCALVCLSLVGVAYSAEAKYGYAVDLGNEWIKVKTTFTRHQFLRCWTIIHQLTYKLLHYIISKTQWKWNHPFCWFVCAFC